MEYNVCTTTGFRKTAPSVYTLKMNTIQYTKKLMGKMYKKNRNIIRQNRDKKVVIRNILGIRNNKMNFYDYCWPVREDTP